MGMGMRNGWIEHIFLALAAASVEAYFLFKFSPASEKFEQAEVIDAA